MERIPDKVDSKFRYILLASHRAEQLMRGAQPKIEMSSAKITRIAMEEVIHDAVTWDYGPEPEVADKVGEAEEPELEES